MNTLMKNRGEDLCSLTLCPTSNENTDRDPVYTYWVEGLKMHMHSGCMKLFSNEARVKVYDEVGGLCFSSGEIATDGDLPLGIALQQIASMRLVRDIWTCYDGPCEGHIINFANVPISVGDVVQIEEDFGWVLEVGVWKRNKKLHFYVATAERKRLIHKP